MYEAIEVQGKVYEIGKELKWYRNLPFEMFSRPVIEQLSHREFSYEEYLHFSSVMNYSPAYWNLVLVREEDASVITVNWGVHDPLEKHLHVLRVSTHPDFFFYQGTAIAESTVDEVKKLAQSLKAKKVFWITDKYRAFLKKLPGLVYLSDARVLEVY